MKNVEGYTDETAHRAIANYIKEIKAFRPFVYICSAYRGDVDNNVEKARHYSRVAIENGYIPITPHIYFTQFLNDENAYERELGIELALKLLGICSEVWVFGKEVTSGMQKEIRIAKRKNKKIVYKEA